MSRRKHRPPPERTVESAMEYPPTCPAFILGRRATTHARAMGATVRGDIARTHTVTLGQAVRALDVFQTCQCYPLGSGWIPDPCHRHRGGPGRELS